MRFVNTLLLFGGYVLVYAATANKGRFAADPWAGIFTDAYPMTVGQAIQGAAQPQGGGGTTGQRRGRPRGTTGGATP